MVNDNINNDAIIVMTKKTDFFSHFDVIASVVIGQKTLTSKPLLICYR